MNFLQYCKSREVRIEISHRLEDDTFHFIFYHEDGYAQQFVLSSLEANALDRNLESYLVALAELEYEKQLSAAKNNEDVDRKQGIFPTKRDAELVLINILDIVKKYGFISVLDAYNIIGDPYKLNYVGAAKHGWTNLNKAMIGRNRDGYVIILPEPVLLD